MAEETCSLGSKKVSLPWDVSSRDIILCRPRHVVRLFTLRPAWIGARHVDVWNSHKETEAANLETSVCQALSLLLDSRSCLYTRGSVGLPCVPQSQLDCKNMYVEVILRR